MIGSVSEELIRGVYWTATGKRGTTLLLDDAGVPLVDYGYFDGVYVGKQRNPVTISYQAGHEESKQLFLNCLYWLVSNIVYQGQYAVLEYAFDWHYGNMTAPWRSGMAAPTILPHGHSSP